MISIDEIKISNMNVGEIKKIVSCFLKQETNDLDYEKLKNILKKDERKTVQRLSDNLKKAVENKNREIERVKKMYQFDIAFKPFFYLAGVDEVGRGPLAGPIVAAAVILDLNDIEGKNLILKINDSKKLSPKTRNEISEQIKEKAISYCIVQLNNSDIDKKGIAWCNNEVLKRAAENLKVKPDLVLSDGYGIKNCKTKNKYIIKGDAKSASIACASIIAKVYRDNIMKEYAKIYPEYGFDKNVGYGTKDHIEAIKKYGYTPIHRISFLKNIL